MSTTPPRILIIDNDEGMVEALSIRLESEGYACLTAQSGSQGLALFSEVEFDAVIPDLNMPSGDGVLVTEKIRKVSNVPVVVITGFEASYADQLADIENVTLLQKPFDMITLLDELDIAITLSPTRMSL